MLTFNPQRPSHAFTLVELLVVVSIIALLLAILLPSLSKARGSAQAVFCTSLLRQMATANHMYADDNNDYTVPMMQANWTKYWSSNTAFLDLLAISAADDTPHNSQGMNWANPYWPGKFLCPNSNPKMYTCNDPNKPNYYRAGASWGMNANGLYVSKDSAGRSQYVVRRAQLLNMPVGQNNPTSKVFMMDGKNEEIDGGSHADPAGYAAFGESPTSIGQKYVAYRHESKANVAYHDGHAAAADYMELWNYGNAETTRQVWKLKLVAAQN